MIIRLKVPVALILLFCVVLLCFFTTQGKTADITVSQNVKIKPQVILDAGHGGLTNTID